MSQTVTVDDLFDRLAVLIKRGQGSLPVGYTEWSSGRLRWVPLPTPPQVQVVGASREHITAVDLTCGYEFVGEVIEAS